MTASPAARGREGDPPVLLLASLETLLLDEEVERIAQRVVPGPARDMNFRALHGWEASSSDLLEFLQSMPFLAERRLLVLKQAEELEGWEDLLPYLKDPNPASVLVMTCLDPKSRSSAYKGLKAAVTPRELRRPKPEQMAKWVSERFARLGKKALPRLASALVDAVGQDLTSLDGEIAKVALHAGGREEILAEDLTVSMPGNVERLWSFLDAVAEGEAVRALGDLRALTQAGARTEQVVYQLARHFRRLARGRSLVDGGASPLDAARKLGLTWDFQQKKFARQVRRANIETLAGRVRTLARYDRRLKTERQSEAVLLDSLVLELLS